MKEKSLDKILVFWFIICAIGMAMTYIFSGVFFIVLTFSGYAIILIAVFILWYKISVETQKNFDKTTELLMKRYG